MATAVETLDKLERRITITLPLADVQAEVEKQLKIRARSAKAPGFRPGRLERDRQSRLKDCLRSREDGEIGRRTRFRS